MTATCASRERFATSRSLGPRSRHCRKPLRDTPSTLHSRAIGCQPACASIQAYFTVTPWQSTPPLSSDAARRWPDSSRSLTRRLRLAASSSLIAFARDSFHLAAAVGAVAGRGRQNGRWHSHKKELGARESFIEFEIPRDAPEPFRLGYGYPSQATIKVLFTASP